MTDGVLILAGLMVMAWTIGRVADELAKWREAWLTPYDGDCLEEDEFGGE